MRLRRWESWIVLQMGYLPIKEFYYRRHFTEKGAYRFAKHLATAPKVRAAAGREGVQVSVHPEARKST